MFKSHEKRNALMNAMTTNAKTTQKLRLVYKRFGIFKGPEPRIKILKFAIFSKAFLKTVSRLMLYSINLF